MATEQSSKAFIDWLKTNDPFLYAVAMRASQLKSASKSELGFFDLSSVNFTDLLKSASTVIKDVAPKVVELRAQTKILDANLKRASQGLAPLEQGYVSTVPAYNPNNPTQEQQRLIDQLARQSLRSPAATKSNFLNFLPWIALGVGGVYFISKRKE